MPKLPDFTDLSGPSIGPARSFVALPGADIAGAASAVAAGIGQVGESIESVQEERRKKFAAQERFNTKIGLLRAEEAYADRVKDLDPLDPEYVEKKKAARREIFAPVLSSVKDPDNKMDFDLATEEDYVNIGIKAQGEARAARGKKQVIDLETYVDGVRKGVKANTYKGDPIADVTQMVADMDVDEVTKQELLPKLIGAINGDQLETEFSTIVTGGVSVTPSVQNAVAKAVAGAAPGAPSWLGDYLLRAAMIESRGGRAKVNPESPNVGGTWQIHTDTAPELGLSAKDRFDDEKAAAATTKLAMRDFKLLKEALGRDPTPAELYLAHQQGIGGAPKLLANPDAKAADVVGKKAVELNLPKSLRGRADTITAGQFAEYVMSKFSGDSSGAIDANDTIETLRLTDSYKRMTADEQAVAETDFLKRIEKQNKEAEKATKIQLSRDTVDYAISNFEDRDEAEDYIKKTITDPDTREDALTMMTTQYNRLDENRRIAEKEAIDAAYDAVDAAVAAGDTAAALAAIPDDIPGEDKAKLRKLARDGRAPADDPDTYNEILALKLGTPEEQAQFRDMSLKPFIGTLKPSTIEALVKDQEAMKKKVSTNGSAPSFDTAAEMLNQRLRELDIDTSNKAPAEDIRYTRAIRRIMAENTQAAVDRAGRELTPLEIEKVMDETFMQFKGKVPGWFSTSEETITIKDVVDKYTAEEERTGAEPGSLINEAIADFQAADPNFVVNGAALNEWLKRKMDGAAN